MTGLLSFDAFRVRRSAPRFCVCALLCSLLHSAALAQPPQPSLQPPPLRQQESPAPESDEREVAPASPFQPAGRAEGGEPSYLGLVVDTEKYNRGVIVLQVIEGGPAAKAGIQHADVIVRANDKPLQNAEQLGASLRSLSPGGKVVFQLRRGDRLVWVTAELGRRTSSAEAPAATAHLGIAMSAMDLLRASRLGLPIQSGVVVERVTPGSAADEARIRPGSVIVQFAGQPVPTPEDLRSAVAKRRPGEVVNVRLYEGLRMRSLFVQLGAAAPADANPPRSPQSVLRPADEALTKPTEQALREELKQIRRDIEELQQRADALQRQLQP